MYIYVMDIQKKKNFNEGHLKRYQKYFLLLHTITDMPPPDLKPQVEMHGTVRNPIFSQHCSGTA